MIKSMTGFGRSEIITKEHKISVEIKSVNQRYCDIFVKMPRKLYFLEASVRNLLKEYIGRGKIDIYINYEEYVDNSLSLRVNEPLAKQYVEQLGYLSERFGVANSLSNVVLAKYTDVLVLEDVDIDEGIMWKLLEQAIREAAEKLVETRITEGNNLKADILKKLDNITEHVAQIEARYPAVIEEYRDRLKSKVQDLLAGTQIEEARLATELVFYADKICVDEEVVRLKSHILHLKDTMEEADNIGRKLDFIIQELNRESNTILSKTNDINLTNHGLEVKSEIEKIREQIQNIE